MTQGSVPDWKADHLRLSIFSDRPWELAPDTVFSEVFGNPPEATNQKLLGGESSASGAWTTFRAEVKRTINRFDFFVHPLPPTQSEMSLIPDIGTVLPQFASLVAGWLGRQSQSITRLAAGCGALFEVQDIAAGYQKLHELVRVMNVDVDRFRDFQFQVNIRSNSKVVSELPLNRLTNWSTVQIQANAIGTNGAHLLSSMHYCACLVDVNTDGNRTTPLPQDRLVSLVSELGAEAVRLPREGIE